MTFNTDDMLAPAMVVGADGLIGHALFTKLTFRGLPVLGSTRRKPSKSHSQLVIDLAQPASTWQLPKQVSIAYLCAGIAAIDQCTQKPEATAAINCTATITLAHALADRGATVVYLSSNQVFDGTTPLRKATDAPCPITEYGRQKAATEQAILALGKQGLVVRLTKVLGPSSPLLMGWYRSLKQSQPIHPFFDMHMAPVSTTFVVQALANIAKANLQGELQGDDRLVQISATHDVTYQQAALHIAKHAGAEPSLVQPTSARTAGLPTQATPQHTSMNTSILVNHLNLNPPSPLATLDEVLNLPASPPAA